MAAAQLAPVRRRLGTASYPAWFYIPAAVVFGVLFLAPMIMSFYFSLTRWTLFESTFIGFDNFAQFCREPFLVKGLVNTLIRPILVILTLPVTLLTLGLFIFIINALLFLFVGNLLAGFQVASFGAALLGSILYSVISWLLSGLLLRE